jgi:hypothetical protein
MKIYHSVKLVTEINEATAPEGMVARLENMPEKFRVIFFSQMAQQIIEDKCLPILNKGNTYAVLSVVK